MMGGLPTLHPWVLHWALPMGGFADSVDGWGVLLWAQIQPHQKRASLGRATANRLAGMIALLEKRMGLKP